MSDKSATPDVLDKSLVSVGMLLADPSLTIPQYQRPYKWTSKNINQLLSDIAAHQGKSSYRLGTIVFHQEDSRKNIVDGQQRTITLILIVRALIKVRKEKIDRNDLKGQLGKLEQVMIDPCFQSAVSRANISNNYHEICRIVERPEFSEDQIDFLLNKCMVVTFTLKDISEAFQFFDSQNARGRDLEPHDLLKAFHLREFGAVEESTKADVVASWERCETEELASLFAMYLYRIRNWAKGHSARYFGKKDVGLFKGVNMETVARYPCVEQLRIAHHYVDHYNRQYERQIDGRSQSFPFQLDQTIINGRRFFELIAHYQKEVSKFNKRSESKAQALAGATLDGLAAKIMEAIDTYEGRTRTGDRYVRTLFDCLLIYYIDKFGHVEVSRAIEKIFIWAYSLRLKMQVVQLASMDNHVLENNLFRLLKEATRPDDFIHLSLPQLEVKNSTKTEGIEILFRELRYYAR